MAKKGMVNRELKREKTVAKYAEKRAELKATISNVNATEEERFEAMLKCDSEAFKQFFHGMLKRGIYLAPSAFEAGFISSMHSDEDIEKTIAAAKATFVEMQNGSLG